MTRAHSALIALVIAAPAQAGLITRDRTPADEAYFNVLKNAMPPVRDR
jgi:hypothetical protein